LKVSATLAPWAIGILFTSLHFVDLVEGKLVFQVTMIEKLRMRTFQILGLLRAIVQADHFVAASQKSCKFFSTHLETNL